VEWFAQHFYQIVAVLLGLLLLARILTSITPARREGQRRRESRSMPLFRFGRPREGSRVIRVIGVGGGGGNAVDLMVRTRTRGVELIACNTDSQALGRSIAPRRIQIGSGVTHGRGAGGDPSLGEKAAEADAKKIGRALDGSDIVFITAGLGGGTGSGAAPVIARIAQDLGALTIAVVTKPFSFEGPARKQIAEIAAASLEANADTVVTIPNDRVRSIVPTGSTMLQAFRTVDEVLHEGVQAIVDVISRAGVVNLDFADVRAIMEGAGPALVGVGRASGEDRAVLAARQAIASPLLETEIAGARRILFNVLGSSSLRLDEVTAAAEEIRRSADPAATVIFGAGLDKRLGDTIQITVIATGFDLAGEPAPSHTTVAAARPDETPVTPAARIVERRAPVDLEAPSFIRRGRRAGDAPLIEGAMTIGATAGGSSSTPSAPTGTGTSVPARSGAATTEPTSGASPGATATSGTTTGPMSDAATAGEMGADTATTGPTSATPEPAAVARDRQRRK
jgi:cell division protein FtsZ